MSDKLTDKDIAQMCRHWYGQTAGGTRLATSDMPEKVFEVKHEGPGHFEAAGLRAAINGDERGSDLIELGKHECWDCGRRVWSLEDGRCSSCNARP